MNKLSGFVRERRLDEAMTQQQFSEKIGITSVTLSNLENGKTIGSRTLRILSLYFSVPTKLLRSMMLYEDDK
jgi:transcriptional regulator with XRE-family HTH domain